MCLHFSASMCARGSGRHLTQLLASLPSVALGNLCDADPCPHCPVPLTPVSQGRAQCARQPARSPQAREASESGRPGSCRASCSRPRATPLQSAKLPTSPGLAEPLRPLAGPAQPAAHSTPQALHLPETSGSGVCVCRGGRGGQPRQAQ